MDTDMFCEDNLIELLTQSNFEMNECNNQDTFNALISSLQSDRNVEEWLKNAQILVNDYMSRVSIIIVEDQLLKHFIPKLKDIYVNVFKEIHSVVQKGISDLSQKIHVVQNHLHFCINLLQILDGTFDCILNNKQFTLYNIKSLPFNTVEMLLITFTHCKESNTLYEGYHDKLTEMFTMFKLAHEIHKKLLTLLLQHVTDVLEDKAKLLKDVLTFLVKIGEVLSCINIKANANNWKGYVDIVQKFSPTLKECSFHTEEPLLSLSSEILKHLNLQNKVPNVNSLRLCNFCLKIIIKLCELFSSNTHWTAIYNLLLTIYRYHPSLLKGNGYSQDIIRDIHSLVFSQVDILLEKLCYQSQFYEFLQTNQESTAANLLFYTLSFKKLAILMPSHSHMLKLKNIAPTINVFFKLIENSYYEFWKIIILTSDSSNSLYDETVTHLAGIMGSLSDENYSEIENILFANIFSQSPWCSLLAIDVWYMVLRKEPLQLSYDTICNIVEQTKHFIVDNQIKQPQFCFLKHLLKRLFENLSSNYRAMLLDKYPLYDNLHVWKLFGFKSFPKTEVIGIIAAEVITVVHKTNAFLSGKCNLNDFKALCSGLETVSYITEHSDIDISHLVLSLFKLWKFVHGCTAKDTIFFKYFLQALLLATTNFLLHFTNDRLILILNSLKEILNSTINIKITTTSMLHTLARKHNETGQNKLFTIISEMFYKLLTDDNPIIKQNALEVFLQFSDSTQNNVITQNAIKDCVEVRISNFINNVADIGPLSTAEYFLMQSHYKYSHQCVRVSSSVSNHKLGTSIKQNEAEIDAIIKRIKTDVQLFHILSDRSDEAEENTVQIMKILHY